MVSRQLALEDDRRASLRHRGGEPIPHRYGTEDGGKLKATGASPLLLELVPVGGTGSSLNIFIGSSNTINDKSFLSNKTSERFKKFKYILIILVICIILF